MQIALTYKYCGGLIHYDENCKLHVWFRAFIRISSLLVVKLTTSFHKAQGLSEPNIIILNGPKLHIVQVKDICISRKDQEFLLFFITFHFQFHPFLTRTSSFILDFVTQLTLQPRLHRL